MTSSNLVTRAQFAQMRGVSKKTVTVWVQRGRISVKGDGKGACIDPVRANVELMNSAQRADAERDLLGVDEPATQPERPKKLTDHRSEVEEHRAALLKLKLERERGELILRDQVEREQETAALTVKRAIDTIPSRAEDILGAAKDGGVLGVRKALRAMVREIEAGLEKSLIEAAERIEAELERSSEEDADAA